MRRVLVALTLTFSCGQAGAVETIWYNGKRADTFVDVISKTGLSTAHAVIVTKLTRRDAAIMCRDDNSGELTADCVRLTLSPQAALSTQIIRANCATKIFNDFFGKRHRFYGVRKNVDQNEYSTGGHAKFSIIDLADGSEEAEGPTFYTTNLDIFRALCPKQAPSKSAGYDTHDD